MLYRARDRTNIQLNNETIHYTEKVTLFGLGFVMILSSRLGFLRGVFLANHLASTDDLTRTTKRQNT